jgi:hypothetical protein
MFGATAKCTSHIGTTIDGSQFRGAQKKWIPMKKDGGAGDGHTPASGGVTSSGGGGIGGSSIVLDVLLPVWACD